MDCQNLHQQLDDFLDGRLDSAAMAEFERHIAGCSPCRTQLTRELLLHLRLRHLPAAHPPAGFADRVIAATRAARPAPAWPAYALAASLALGLGIALALWQGRVPATAPAAASAKTVAVHPGQVQPVRLVFNYPGALSNVTVRIELPEGVEMAGYPGLRELAWQTNLKPGANLLELPVLVHGAGGVLTASLSYGAERRQFSVVVRAEAASSLLRRGPDREAAILIASVARMKEVSDHA